jgi:hypothetical protein
LRACAASRDRRAAVLALCVALDCNAALLLERADDELSAPFVGSGCRETRRRTEEKAMSCWRNFAETNRYARAADTQTADLVARRCSATMIGFTRIFRMTR